MTCGQARVAIVADNSTEFVLLDLAVTKANLVLVPINTRLLPEEWSYIIDHSESVVVFASDAYCPGLDKVRGQLTRVAAWVATGAPPTPSWTALADFVGDRPAQPAGAAAADDDIELQLYTSGTTGLPKGVEHTHRSMTISTTQWAQVVEPWDGLRGRTLLAAPLFHGAPLIIARTTLCWGGHVQTQPRFDPEAVLDAALAGPIAWTMLVPSMIHMCIERARSRPRSHYQFGVVMYGGSPIAESVLREAMQYLGTGFVQIYGLTEALLTTTLTPADHARALRGEAHLLQSAGGPIAGVSVAIEQVGGGHEGDDGDGGESSRGQVVISCPNPMVGYAKDPSATAEILHDGKLYSGDAGYLGAGGYLFIRDRVKDMIVTGGENVFSTEVEGVLHAHPGVADVAVIGSPHPRWGEIVTAVLVAEPGHHLDADEIVAFCRERISPYKVPRRVDVVEALPRNSMGKLLKGRLREAYWHGAARSI